MNSPNVAVLDGRTAVTRSTSSVSALVLLHGANGNPQCFEPVRRALQAKQPNLRIVAPRSPGVADGAAPPASLAEVTATYADLVCRELADHQGSIVVAGHSIGATLGHALAVELRARNRTIRSVVAIDSRAPGFFWPDLKTAVTNALATLRAGHVHATAHWAVAYVKRKRRGGKSTATDEQLASLGFSGYEQRHEEDLTEHFLALERAWTLPPADIDMLLVRGSEIWPMFPPGYAWGPYVSRLRTADVRGDHFTVLVGDAAAKVADLLVAECTTGGVGRPSSAR
jgi:thioesterase domain-containing protein